LESALATTYPSRVSIPSRKVDGFSRSLSRSGLTSSGGSSTGSAVPSTMPVNVSCRSSQTSPVVGSAMGASRLPSGRRIRASYHFDNPSDVTVDHREKQLTCKDFVGSCGLDEGLRHPLLLARVGQQDLSDRQ
jgi:hypothetical protein